MASGLLLRTILQLWNVNPGFNRQHVITFKVGLSPSLTTTAASTRTAYRQLLDRICEIPGVQAADFTNVVPLSENDNGGPFWVGAQQSTSMQDAPHALYFETGPEYLQAMQIPLLRGRFFSRRTRLTPSLWWLSTAFLLTLIPLQRSSGPVNHRGPLADCPSDRRGGPREALGPG